MMNSIKICFFLFAILTFNLIADNGSPFIRYPDINSNGSKITFNFQGDIWVINSNGTNLNRLTIHQAYDYAPLWSPDDKSIAFSSNRFNNYDIFIMPASGGIPKRLTFHSSSDLLNDYTADNTLLFTTSRTFRHVEWDHELDEIPVSGGTPSLLIDAVGEMPAKSPDGKFIAFVKGGGRVTRVAYRGSANNEIWLYDTLNKSYKKLTDFEGHDIYPRWTDSKTIYYVSAESGTYNIHKILLDKDGNKIGNSVQITNYDDDGVRYFNVSNDGKTAVFERQTDIYILNLENGKISKLNVNIASDYRFDPIVQKTYSDKMTQYQVSPNGKYTTFVVRGEIFITENDKEKNKTVNLTDNPYRDQYPAWLNDSTLIFVSDREGQQDLYLIRSIDKAETDLFKSLKHEVIKLTETPEDESWPIISPDQKQIAYEIGIGKLVVADIDEVGQITKQKTLLDGWAAPGNVSWSPDSKWLSYSLDDLYFNSEVFIHSADNEIEPINVSMHPRGDYSPAWSKDGTKLGWISSRSNNDRSNNDADVWFVWLNKEDWERTKEDWEEYEKPKEKKDAKKEDKEKKEKKVELIKIDIENIFERSVKVTSLAGNEEYVQFSDDGETIYFTSKSPTKKGRDIFSIKWDGKHIKEITTEGGNPENIKISSDGKYLFFSQKGKLNRIDLGKTKKDSLAFEAKMSINYPIEKEQKFDEGWRALRDGFYDPNFHGQNWTELKKKYKPWCLAASTDQDFQDMYNIMLGELNASHMGMRGMDTREDTQKEKTGLLGIRIEAVDNGVKVIHVVDKTPASKKESKLEVGDVITRLNGEKISNNFNFYSLLANTSNEKLLLEISRNEKTEEIAIRPTGSIRNQLYDEWVNNNRDLVDKYSDGKLGYLHIRAMGWPSFERFEREFTAQAYGKKGIVIDVRYNGGGWTTDYLMMVLNYKQHAYTIPRGAADNLSTEKENFREYYPLGERLPYSAWTKPSIALCNQSSYSNAEIFSHAYKNLDIGHLVGVPTFGAVISTGARVLIDGSYVRMPSRGWFVMADNSNMDFVPAVPDIIVENPPNEKTKDNDYQLLRAVTALLKEIK